MKTINKTNMNNTFDSLPGLVAEINKKIDILMSDRESPATEEDYLMSVEGLIDYLPEKPARQTIYGWIHNSKIPYEKHGKRLYFRKSEINNWLTHGRQL